MKHVLENQSTQAAHKTSPILRSIPAAAVLGFLLAGLGCRGVSEPINAAPPGRAVTDARGVTVTVGNADRIVSAGGSVTETIHALGLGDRLVGTDASSVFPESVTKLPQIGYVRTLSAEGVLSLKPSLVITTTEAGPPPALTQIEGAGVPLLVVPTDHSVEGVKRKIRLLASALGVADRGEALIASLDADLSATRSFLEGVSDRPRVMFIYARGQGTLNVAGRSTAADAMIRLAGGVNPFEYEGYKPLTPEAAAVATPDVIVLPSRGLDSLGGADALVKTPGIAVTPAGVHNRIVALDDLFLLGFGPRTGRAALELARALHAK